MRFARPARAAIEREGLPYPAETPLTVVVAPGGFGKSALLGAWQQASPRSAVGTFDAFFRTNSLDAGLVLTDCAGALGVAEGTLRDAIGVIEPDGDALGREFVQRLGRALQEVQEPFVCFLDDLHDLPEETSRDVGRVISAVADQDHRFVVASRTGPPWPVERWRVAGFADVITADRLRFTRDEVVRLLGPDLEHQTTRVLDATGGWPAAVETIRWRLAAAPTLDLDVAVLDLVDYVVAEVLPLLPAQEMRVLSRTSILQPFPVSVATSVSGESSAAGVLADVHLHTSLVTRLGDGRFRYHAILRTALHRHLVRTEPDRERELQLRAADAWLDEPDSFDGLCNALDHLIEARSWERAVELLRTRMPEIDRHSRLDLFAHWLDAIPGNEWRPDLEMMLLYLWANLRVGRTERALAELNAPAIARNSEAAAVAKLTYAWMTSWTTDPYDALQVCEQIRPVLSAIDASAEHRRIPTFPGVSRFELAAEIAVAQSHVLLGRYEEATEKLPPLLRRRAEISPLPQFALCGALAFALAMQGQATAATARAAEALQIAADAGAVAEQARTASALLAQAVVAATTGDPATALATVDKAAADCRPIRAANLLATCGLVAAMCGTTRSYLADVEPPLTPAELPIVACFTSAAAARQQARLGEHAGAERQLRAAEPHELTLSAWVEVLLHRIDRARVRRWVAARTPPTCLRGRVVRLLAEAATAEQDSETTRLVRAAAELADREHLVGVLIDAPEQLWRRFDLDTAAQPILIETAIRLGEAAPQDGRPELTARELEVLRLLPYVATTSELATRLFVSVNTAKWHQANLYTKLGVHRRADAVARGIELGLIAGQGLIEPR